MCCKDVAVVNNEIVPLLGVVLAGRARRLLHQLLPALSTLYLSMDSQETANYINIKLLSPLFHKEKSILSLHEPVYIASLM